MPYQDFQTDNIRIEDTVAVPPPAAIRADLPITEAAAQTVAAARQVVHSILNEKDDRLLVIIGPCSIHDSKAAHEYARRLAEARQQFETNLFIIMRVYFEKPRTTIGWKGLINDPDLDDSFDINKGLHLARGLLLDLAAAGMPAGVEFLDLISPQYLSDLVAWGAIGARTTESQGHREMASGLSCPVGFKNGTGGTVQIAVDAIRSAAHPHRFLGINQQGQATILKTRGNPDCHVILRGGKEPNYDSAAVTSTAALLEKAGLPQKIMIDTSHANSQKIPERQLDVARDIAAQLTAGDKRIFGVMVESHLMSGRQDNQPGVELQYGQSITDACLGWTDSLQLLETLAEASRSRRQK
ncbi:MAG: 3-deoxy-7-phosphoheptulonate synthase [Leptospiraceae bacterium]|nr:3-deoxy-7-phosphoheptulonate synthase [Leptospiraceae bacterium]